MTIPRDFAGDNEFGAAQEHDMIHREIIDRELREVHEEIQRICDQTREPVYAAA